MQGAPGQSENKYGRDLTSGSIPRHLVIFSLPMLAGSLIQTGYSIVNAVWVGKGLGKTELAAVTAGFPVAFMLIAIAAGLTMAASILVAQFAGARNWDQLRRVVQTSTVLVAAVSVLLLPIGQLLTPWILRQMHTAPEVYPLAVSYMRIFLFTIPLHFGIYLVAAMLRGVGDSKTPLYFQSAALVLTAILDPILMFGWLGFPRMGLNGTAVATVAMQAISLLATFVYLHRKDHIVAPNWRRLRADWPTACLTLKIGFPSMVQYSLMSLGMVFVLGFVNAFGENATAAFGAAMRIDQIAFLPAMTFGAAVSTLAGQNIGAGRLHRVNQVFWWGILLSGGITLLVSLVAVAAPRLLLRMFLSDPEAIQIGISYLRIVGGCYVFFAAMFISNGIINAAGYTVVTTVISLVSLWIVRVPLAAYLTQHLQAVEGVWYAMSVSFFLSMAISLAYYFSGRWKRPIVPREPLAGPAPALETVGKPEGVAARGSAEPLP